MTNVQNMNSLEQILEALGEETVVKYVKAHQRSIIRSVEYGKRDRAILKEFKAGRLSFGGTRVDMTAEVEE